MRKALLLVLLLLAPLRAELRGPEGELWVRPGEVVPIQASGSPGEPMRLVAPDGQVIPLAEGPPGRFSVEVNGWRNGSYRLQQGHRQAKLGPVRVLSGRLPTARVTRPNAIYRSGPGEEYDRLDPLPAGLVLSLEGRQHEWLRSGPGWVAVKDVQVGGFPAPQPRLIGIRMSETPEGRAVLRLRLGEPVACQVDSRPEQGELTLRLPGARLTMGEVAYAPEPRRVRAVQLASTPEEAQVRLTLGPEGNWGYQVRWEPPDLVLDLTPPPHRGWSNPPRPGGAGTGRPLVGLVIALDAGHGGSDSGAVGLNLTREKDLNLALALALKQELEREGARVIMTRDTDRDVAAPEAPAEEELAARVRLAEEGGAHLFVSLHHNAMADVEKGRKAHGVHIYSYRPHSRALAEALAHPLAAATGESEWMALWRSFHVTRQSGMPAVLVESNFISNPEVEARMGREDYIPQAARGLKDGIEAFLRAAAGP
ncbi:MAG: hypothetical protein AMXMBFR33_06040 [Candidatus Xenobia bacterium]